MIIHFFLKYLIQLFLKYVTSVTFYKVNSAFICALKTISNLKIFIMSFFDIFGGSGAQNQVKKYQDKGAVVIDVRTPMEFEDGHAPGSILITLDSIPESVDRIKAMNKPVILVCRTGARAGSAQAYLKRFGIDVINAGPWQAVL